MRKGLIVVVSGFSGAGKGTLMKRLVTDYDQYELNISATTRKPREGEVDGREYHFVTKECFKKMIENDELMEYAEYVEHSYGSPTAYVMEKGRLVKSGEPRQVFQAVAFMESIQLGVPKITKFAQELKNRGLTLPYLPITIKEFKELLHG